MGEKLEYNRRMENLIEKAVGIMAWQVSLLPMTDIFFQYP